MEQRHDNKARKTLSFDKSIKEQNLTFIFLEKIRYNQTRFITKLVMDFIKTNNIDINGNYKELTNKCRDYIESTDALKPDFSTFCTVDVYNEVTSRLDEINEKLRELQTNENIQKTSQENKTAQTDQFGLPKKESEPQEKTDDSLGNMLSSFKMMADR